LGQTPEERGTDDAR
jgi:hypothetical protein